MLTFNIVFPTKAEFSDIHRWISDRNLYRDVIVPIRDVGVQFEYFAEDVAAPKILKEFECDNTRCITTLPRIDEEYYFKRLADRGTLPIDFRERYEERIELPHTKFKYPKATKFRVLTEYLQVRENAFNYNMREAMSQYLLSRQYVIYFDSHNSLCRNPMNTDKEGMVIISVDLSNRQTYTYYGGTWVDIDMLLDILEMEMEEEVHG